MKYLLVELSDKTALHLQRLYDDESLDCAVLTALCEACPTLRRREHEGKLRVLPVQEVGNAVQRAK